MVGVVLNNARICSQEISIAPQLDGLPTPKIFTTGGEMINRLSSLEGSAWFVLLGIVVTLAVTWIAIIFFDRFDREEFRPLYSAPAPAPAPAILPTPEISFIVEYIDEHKCIIFYGDQQRIWCVDKVQDSAIQSR